MRAWGPAVVLLTGDVSEDASSAAYTRVAAMLDSIDAPVLAVPGNHDCPDEMQRHFPQGPWRGPRVKEFGPWLLVLMDSTVPGSISGSFSQLELDALAECLRESPARYILLALHHQPVLVNAPWIDRYALQEPAPFFEILDQDERPGCVIWGHVHQAFHAQRNSMQLFGAPSTVANSLPETKRFTPDAAGPACRWLELGQDGTVATGLLRPDQSSTGSTNHKIR